ncbi:hypothetical protein E3U23_09705 [Erythrobacter litoralis]|uniref:hypothetical protein n=1 Tax=Erythrobacter litoralis TaxID=39960 RepID=UPI002435BE8D|nr:hypothetical protein [Erythrobacter litoralis]MDG6079467.1 hypothetical protein [Erythrobacter litoralis]
MRQRNLFTLILLPILLSACVSSPKTPYRIPSRGTSAPGPVPPQRQPAPNAPASDGFIVPEIMRAPGLEGIIGRNATALANIFGAPRLDVAEGDAQKLQFTGQACVLDIYLYPLRPGAEPSATHIEARRASDGQSVDRASCIAALRR